MKRIRLIFIFSLIFLNLTSPVFSAGSSKLVTDGEFAIEAYSGNFEEFNSDILTNTISKNKYASSIQQTFLSLNLDYMHNITKRFIFDITQNFYGKFATPQEFETDRYSELLNNFKMRFGINHNEKTVSEFVIFADHSRYTMDLYNESDVNLWDYHYMVDHAISNNTYLTFNTGVESMEYPHSKTDDYHRIHNNLKLTRYIRGVGKPSKFFKYYPFEKMPEEVEKRVEYMDLYWEIIGSFDKYEMRMKPKGYDHDDANLGINLNLVMSEFAEVKGGISTNWRSHEIENPLDNTLNFDKNRMFITLSQYMNKKLKIKYFGDFINYNYLNLAGYDYNELLNSIELNYLHREDIKLDIEIKNSNISYNLLKSVFPNTSESTIKTSWSRNYGLDKAFTLFEEIIHYDVSGNESAIYSSYLKTKFGFIFSRRITDDLSVDFGLVKSKTSNFNFHENDIEELYLHTSTKWIF